MFSSEILDLSARLVEAAQRRGWQVTCAESCTGGLISAALTATAGASVVFDRGFITYHNDAKAEMLGISAGLLKEHGAVSEAVARAMAEGALEAARANLALAVTGIAGPGGGTPQKPVGLVHIAVCRRDDHGPKKILHERHEFSGARDSIRLQAVGRALSLSLEMINAP